MLKHDTIFMVDGKAQDIRYSGELSGQSLIAIFNEVDSRSYLLLASKAIEPRVLADLMSVAENGGQVKVLTPDSERKRFEDMFSGKKIVMPKIATYRKKCNWHYATKLGSLKYLEIGKRRVMIVDDSETIRKILQQILTSDPRLEVVASVADPRRVEDEIRKHRPDVMTLDINMPNLSGVEVLDRLQGKYFIPTVMISSIDLREGGEVMQALAKGAVDYIQKPSLEELDAVRPVIIEKILTAADINLREKIASTSLQKLAKAKVAENLEYDAKKVIFIGSSTGGTEAIRAIFRSMPKKFPPILVAQHIPPLFSQAFAESLSREFLIESREAKDGDFVRPNQILIAPGGLQMEIVNSSLGLKVHVYDGPKVNLHRPSVETLFLSGASVLGRHCVGVMLTGMGGDGVKGMLEMKKQGAMTFAQSEETCIVYGMPKVAFEAGAVQKMVPLNEMAVAMLQACQLRRSVAS